MILCCAIAFKQNRVLTFAGYDGAFQRTTIKLQHEWMSPLPWLGGNPFQGLGNQFFMYNSYFMPSFGLAALVKNGEAGPRLTYTLLAVEIFLALSFLAWSLRWQPALGVLAGWLAVFGTLPFTFPTLLYPLTCYGAQFAESIAFELVMIGLFHRVGQGTRWQSAMACAGLCGTCLWMFVANAPPC